MAQPMGHRRWAIAEGYIPEQSTGPEPEMTSHETVCILNTSSDKVAKVEITILFEDRDPAGPYEIHVPPQRTKHVRFNELEQPEPIPVGTDYASVIKANIPVVVQHSRLDSRQSENALLSTTAFGTD